MDDLPIGSRVSLRRRLAPEEVTPEYSMTDVTGQLVDADETHLWVETRRGRVQVARADLVAARVVPPRPARRGAPHRAVGIGDLQRIMTKGQPGIEQEWLGEEYHGWLLRSAGRWTGRSNSVLTVGEPGLPLEEAVAAVEHWYADREAPALFMLPRPTGAGAAEDPLGELLLDRGFVESPPVDVLTGRVSDLVVAGGQPPGLRLTTSPTPDEDWLRGCGPRLQEHLGTARRVLTIPRRQVFLTAHDDEGGVVGVVRVAMDDAWAGVFGLHVAPERRREGIGRWLTREAALAIQAAGTDLVYLQVERDNAPARSLYTALGMEVHHEYTYLRPPR